MSDRRSVKREGPDRRQPRVWTPGRVNGHHDADIARRAYEIFEARGGAEGHDVDDWLQAERELRAADKL